MAGRSLTRGQVRFRGGLLALAVLLAVVAVRDLGLLERVELALLDARFTLRGELPPHPEIVLVGLDEESAARYGQRVASWSRAQFARAIENLSRAGASLVALDVILAREDPDPNLDAALAAAVEAAGNVILVADVSDRNAAWPLPALRAVEAGEGFVNLVRDADGKVRKIPPPRLLMEASGGGSPEGPTLVLPLAVEIAVHRAHPDAPPEVHLGEETYRLGDVEVRASRGGMLVNFPGGPGSFPVIPFWRALEGDLPEGALRGKVALVGSMHPLQHDHFPTPFRGETHARSIFRERTDVILGDLYGIEIHAAALDTILSGRPLAAAGEAVQTTAWAAVGALGGWVLIVLRLRPWAAAAAAAGGILALAAAAQALFAGPGLVVEAAPGPLIVSGQFAAGLLYHRALDLRRKREIQGLFGRYVSPQVAELLLRDPSLVRLGGRKAVLTVFFSDIRGFTSLSEKIPPEEVARLLHEYFTAMTAIVFRHGGTLDKFIGDAIMVFFGDPIPMEDHAERAVRMALDMRAEMEALKARWRAEGRPTFDPGMGINTGEVVVGNTGSAERVSYTVIGDNVNLAQRLESNAGPGQILISAAARAAVPEADAKFVLDPLPPIKVKGRERPVEIYQVLSARS